MPRREKSEERGGSLGTTYEIVAPPLKSLEKSAGVLRRLERWALQSVARRVLSDERVASCLRVMIPQANFVKVWQAHERAHYSGLTVCGSVWNCPVCASKISERRRVDLLQGMHTWGHWNAEKEEWEGRGSVLMLVLTVPHYSFQPLKEVLTGFTHARRLLRHRKPWKRIADLMHLQGSARALEVTYGGNGWHVHSHELLFCECLFSGGYEAFEYQILSAWRDACISAGLGAPDHHGAKIQDGTQAGKYASKWGLEHEMTKAHLKGGRDGNLSPWDLLRGIDEGKREYVNLFREYAKGFKGKHQLEWSKGLRELLGLGKEKTDQELAGQIEEEAVLLGMLSREHWRIIRRADRRGELLEVAASSGWDGVVKYIRDLVKMGHGSAPF